ncbi:uncharacterized protein SPPG_09537 [Spizellomyces punctatus DAOM BR117]|uniref:Uncharacterized protein n=1 Tax=Spizellomyces punctatus (strain DAOM BR117) TaxID=645134 RepID=A0A0L0H455_SPIPD|nr:uncharacterized protein SPPG_09537 [Spizellomyces punctatus DAOM BR117]KNC96270.1 hypothetical protein SPPG_09537 [Spizellomyces punctatus DAOM BR117]|eukprot:XP_016604310.1 hypothetical protein SPPG_09537 [Spizellomyces punctatus DAOM BR117]
MHLLRGTRVESHVIYLLLEERREKLLRRVGTVWEVVKNRVVTLGDPAGGQPLAKVIHESSKSSLQNLEASTSYSFNQPAGLPYKSTRPITQYFAGQWATTTNSLVDGSLRDVNLSTILSNVAQTVPSKESLGIQKHADREDSGMGLEEQPSVIEEVRSVVNSVPVQTSGTKEIPPATENHNSPVPGACTGTTRQSKPVEIVEGLDVIADVHDAQVSNYLGLCALKLEREHGQKKKQKKEMAVTPAVEFFESAAERDSASAAYNAGLCHEYAIGGVKRVDSVRAVVLYRQAAVAGHKAAQYNLGILLHPLNLAQECMRREDDQLTAYVTAAKGGSRLAAYNAGVICERRGDIGRAIHWYKMATNSADVDIQRDAHYNIGVLLRHTDAVDAIKHLKAASRLGDTEARACLKEMGQLHKL